MKRLAIAAIVLTTVLVGLILLRLRLQAESISGPPTSSGVVEGTAIDLSSQISARVERVLIKEGASVKKGQVLVELDCADVESTIQEAEARVTTSEAQLASALASAKAARRETGAAHAQAAAALAREKALATRMEHAKRNADRLVRMGDAISASSLDSSVVEADSLQLEKAASTSSTKATMAQASVSSARADAADSQVSAGEATLASVRAARDKALLLRRECRIVAPRDALVEEIVYEVGETPPRGGTLVRLQDISEVKAILYLPNAELGSVKPGGKALVEADAYPGQPLEGQIATVAVEAEFTPRNVQTRTDRDRLVYPVEIRVPNAAQGGKLRPGMPVTITLLETTGGP